ncbi:MAG: hypothetical protein N3A58_03760 [Spirochaetes bacterium]|nr:hypothetical protein [Spirochaetota bacterium]
MKIKFKIYFLFIFILFLLITPFNFKKINSQINEESYYKIFLNKVITEDQEAIKVGKDFLVKFPGSKKIPDILFFLSFVDSDYFNILSYLKRVIFYYEDSIWWEDSVKRITDIYLLNENYKAIEEIYQYYLKFSKSKKLRYLIEINYLESLYKSKKVDILNDKLDNILLTASNKELLAIALYYKGKVTLYFSKNRDISLKYFINCYYYFKDTTIYFTNLLELFNNSIGEYKIYFAKELFKDENLNFIDENLRENIIAFSKRNIYNLDNIKKKLFSNIDEIYKRNYYNIYYIVVKNIDINNDEFKVSFEKFSKIISKYNYPLYFNKNEIYTIYGVGPFHFLEEAKIVLENLKKENLIGTIISMDYSY